MLQLSDKWAPVLLAQPETGMGYQIATITLKDGRTFSKTVIVGGVITETGGQKVIPFMEYEIAEIVVTHEK